MSPMNAHRVRTLAVALLLGGVLTACGDDAPADGQAGGPSSKPTGSANSSTSPTAETTTTTTTREPTPSEPPPYLPVPDGVRLTEQGTRLRLGERASVAWEPRRDTVGVLDVRIQRVERTALKAFAAFQLDRTQRRATPYYVRARVANTGRSDLSGVPVPIYVDAGGVLVQATPIPVRFAPCQPRAFPARYRPGGRVDVCLVYFVPDGSRVDAVTFRPTREYDPITWTGRVTRPQVRR